MKWKDIDKKRMPKETVLAANFGPSTYGYKEKLIGWLYVNEQGVICCENEFEVLENCTHFILINHYDIES